MPGDQFATPRIQGVHADSVKSQQSQQAQKLAQYAIAQESATEEFQEWSQLDAWNPLALARNFQQLEKRVRERGRPEDAHKAEQPEEEGELKIVERLKEVSEDYQRKNPELQSRSLLLLRTRITRSDTPDDILRKVREAYPDISLADEALDFLIETSEPTIRANVEQAKAELNRIYEREIKAGRNMGAQAREFSSQGLGSPTALRDLYRDITRNPRDANALFQELSTNYSYDKMKSVIDFILHSLGSDMKSRGPSISRAELTRYFTEARNMQAILGVYRFFKSRMRLIASSFDRQGLVLPARINFELLAKTFMKFIQERYPSVEKALLLSQQLGIAGETLAQMIIYLQFRDALRQVAPKLFKEERHRQDLLSCFMDTLEELDEEMEEDEEKEEKKKDKDKDKK
jgi:type III secretion protein W